jgi:hypothetical protein
MKRRLRRLTVLFGVIGLVMAFNVGTAFADQTGGTEWTCDDPANALAGESCGGPTNDQDLIGPAAENAFAPVGSHLLSPTAPGNPGSVHGIMNEKSNAQTALINNPLCPLHGVEASS